MRYALGGWWYAQQRSRERRNYLATSLHTYMEQTCLDKGNEEHLLAPIVHGDMHDSIEPSD